MIGLVQDAMALLRAIREELATIRQELEAIHQNQYYELSVRERERGRS